MAKKECVCCICDKPIIDNNYFDMGTNGMRHRTCGPGTKIWEAKFGASPLTDLLQKKSKQKNKKKRVPPAQDPVRRAIKEFCGREKYLRYMDSVNKSIDCDWQISATIGGKKITHSRSQGYIDPDLLYQQLTKGGK